MAFNIKKILKINEKDKFSRLVKYINKFNQYPDLLAGYALQTVLKYCQFNTVLDIGSGAGVHADIFKQHNKKVTTIDFGLSVYYQENNSNSVDIVGDYYTYEFNKKFNLIWASHILEHQINPGLFLKKVYHDLDDDGWLVLTVPPLKHEIVGGHVTLWNGGLLLYQLVLAGFNCRNVSVLQYGYNISIIVRKKEPITLPELHYDSGDIERLKMYLPEKYSNEGFNGDIKIFNWPGVDNEYFY